MSEKEIIEIIKDFLELREIHSSDSMTKSYLSVYKEAIQSLLNLYNKEKERNIELATTIDALKTDYQKEKEKNNNILGLVFECGQIDGEHHKTWVIDQIVRILTENDYDKWVQHYEYDEATGEEYTWDIGIAP